MVIATITSFYSTLLLDISSNFLVKYCKSISNHSRLTEWIGIFNTYVYLVSMQHSDDLEDLKKTVENLGDNISYKIRVELVGCAKIIQSNNILFPNDPSVMMTIEYVEYFVNVYS